MNKLKIDEQGKAQLAKSMFFLVILFAGFSTAAYGSPNSLSLDWRTWIIMISLEALRIALVTSNIEIRKINKRSGNIALILSVIASFGLAAMHHFHCIENGEIDWKTWWMLQTSNWSLVFCEWSISVLIAGKASFNLLEMVKKGVDMGNVDVKDEKLKEIISWVRSTIAEMQKTLHHSQNTVKELTQNLSAKTAENEQLTKSQSIYSNRDDVWKRLWGHIAEGQMEEAGKLVEDTGERLGLTFEQRWSVVRMAAIGHEAKDTRISIGSNQYLVHCSGNGQPGICTPFVINKGHKSMNCPTCGKLHKMEDLVPQAETAHEE